MAEGRLTRIDRNQSYWGRVDLETLIGPEHAARAIWELTGALDLSGFLQDNKSWKAVPGPSGPILGS